ncbi:hypothetical protein PsorP6_001855 [Peronosclerospora sorghi]|uniref:Uncharacterized protein n=1 Tax=Peronosclerospora sorghi TaxID=230839 RepID=A0ACC0WY27_9STRA|nr:hypothetical protein PsorP6_001855 [Peronosclerospora sorghi]
MTKTLSTSALTPSLRVSACNHLFVEARTVTLRMADINDFFICKLCKGYFRDPYTAKECLHTCTSFTDSNSAMAAFEGTMCISHKQTHVQRAASIWVPNRAPNLCKPDPAIKELTDKYLPDYRAKEEEEERKFYASFGIKRKRSETPRAHRHTTFKINRSLGPSSPGHMIQFELHPQRGSVSELHDVKNMVPRLFHVISILQPRYSPLPSPR